MEKQLKNERLNPSVENMVITNGVENFYSSKRLLKFTLKGITFARPRRGSRERVSVNELIWNFLRGLIFLIPIQENLGKWRQNDVWMTPESFIKVIYQTILVIY